jgi:D-alanine-D-alanine ligase
MRVTILHNAVANQSSLDEKDVLVQTEAVKTALNALGHAVAVIPCDLNFSALKKALAESKPDLVFNLVESLAERGSLIHLVPFFLEAMGIPYTGNHAEAVLLTSNKIMAKTRLQGLELPTPGWIGPYPETLTPLQKKGGVDGHLKTTWIIKSVWEHASIGLDEQGILENEPAEKVLLQIPSRAIPLGGACFAEIFIDGREFNLAILDGPEGATVLPPAEILFEGYGPEKPRIVGYQAKWDADSFEYSHTPRHFNFPETDRPILRKLKKLALSAWQAFGLSGYARVDFRVDNTGTPWILEINTNPCLSPDAGFAAALEQANISFTTAIDRILSAALSIKHPLAKVNFSDDHSTDKKSSPLCQEETITNLPGEITFREIVSPEDVASIGSLVDATGFFYEDEVKVAMELIQTTLDIGEASGYRFIFADLDGKTVGYACFGPIACTASAYDLYWIAVHPDFQMLGLGKNLLSAAEKRASEAGGTHMYVETSNRSQYKGTRTFYERHGYKEVSLLEDFYGPADAKVTYCKVL